jgi:hypothetical protein
LKIRNKPCRDVAQLPAAIFLLTAFYMLAAVVKLTALAPRLCQRQRFKKPPGAV